MSKKSDMVKIARIQADTAVIQSALRVPEALMSNPNLHFTIAASTSLALLLLLEHNKEWWGKGSEWWANKVTAGNIAPGTLGGLTPLLPLIAPAIIGGGLPAIAAAGAVGVQASMPPGYNWWAWVEDFQQMFGR